MQLQIRAADTGLQIQGMHVPRPMEQWHVLVGPEPPRRLQSRITGFRVLRGVFIFQAGCPIHSSYFGLMHVSPKTHFTLNSISFLSLFSQTPSL